MLNLGEELLAVEKRVRGRGHVLSGYRIGPQRRRSWHRGIADTKIEITRSSHGRGGD